MHLICNLTWQMRLVLYISICKWFSKGWEEEDVRLCLQDFSRSVHWWGFSSNFTGKAAWEKWLASWTCIPLAGGEMLSVTFVFYELLLLLLQGCWSLRGDGIVRPVWVQRRALWWDFWIHSNKQNELRMSLSSPLDCINRENGSTHSSQNGNQEQTAHHCQELELKWHEKTVYYIVDTTPMSLLSSHLTFSPPWNRSLRSGDLGFMIFTACQHLFHWFKRTWSSWMKLLSY